MSRSRILVSVRRYCDRQTRKNKNFGHRAGVGATKGEKSSDLRWKQAFRGSWWYNLPYFWGPVWWMAGEVWWPQGRETSASSLINWYGLRGPLRQRNEQSQGQFMHSNSSHVITHQIILKDIHLDTLRNPMNSTRKPTWHSSHHKLAGWHSLGKSQMWWHEMKFHLIQMPLF